MEDIEIMASGSFSNPIVLPDKDVQEEKEMLSLLESIPVFKRKEIKCGKVLGAGAFCRVCKINNILRSADDMVKLRSIGSMDSDDGSVREIKKRNLIAEFDGCNETPSVRSGESVASGGSRGSRTSGGMSRSSRSNRSNRSSKKQLEPKYAMKFLKSTLDPTDTERGKLDLEKELKMLLKVSGHGNIIALRGIGDSVYPAKSCISKFLILDGLKSTLQQRIEAWKDRRGVGIFEALAINRKRNKDLWFERLTHLSKIAGAVSFMHSRGIIYRDLKPENIGFDYDNNPKVFDFGLARTLDKSLRVQPDTETGTERDPSHYYYNMTGMTGSARYMCPEISQSKPYNTGADVYSLAIVMHEVLSLKLPFAFINDIKTLQLFVNERELRPDIVDVWPDRVTNLLKQMWDGDKTKRTKSVDLVMNIQKLMRGNDDDVYPAWGTMKIFGII